MIERLGELLVALRTIEGKTISGYAVTDDGAAITVIRLHFTDGSFITIFDRDAIDYSNGHGLACNISEAVND